MTGRTRPRRPVQAAALVAVAALLLSVVPASGATAVEISGRPLLGGRYAPGGWLAIVVSLVNEGAPTSGYVAAETPDGEVRRLVDLPAGADKAITLYVRPQNFARSIDVSFVAPEGTATTEVEVRALERVSGQVAVVGDGGGHLRAQLVGAEGAGRPEPLSLTTADIPERSEPLEALGAIAWAADSTALTEEQRRSVERWVAEGGQLVVVGGPDWQARTAAFSEVLPVAALAGAPAVDLSGLGPWSGAGQAPVAEADAASGPLTEDATALIIDPTSGLPVLAFRPLGAGRVIYAALDLATEPYRAWEGAPGLWSRLLPTNIALEQFFGGGFGGMDEAANAMGSALSNLPSLEVPPAELLLVVIVGYILLIGPVSYLLLRRVDRRELAWVTAPVLIILFSACSYGIGTVMKGGEVIVNQITLVRTADGATTATAEAYAGLFSPTRESYDMTADADALLAPVNLAGWEPTVGASRARAQSEQGDPSHLRDISIGVFGFQPVRAEAIVDYEPTLLVEWAAGDGEVTGTITNTGDALMTDVAVISATGGEMVGDLEPGASEEFRLSLVNFNGSAASDQVYGFGGFEPGNIPAREELMRREVINSLVGYGGWFPGQGGGAGIGMSRGPYVIGWLDDPGPLPVTVDDQVVQRYEQTVEVVSGRPGFGSGEVQLEPSEVPVHVVSTDGDVNASEPGWVSIGDGEAVFAMTLPLEASELTPTAITIITGNDPSMVFAPQQGGGFGFMPPGYTLSVRDPATGAWVELGDLGQASSWEVDDPAAILAGGRLEVRVTGEGMQDAFGQNPVFVGARIEGTLP